MFFDTHESYSKFLTPAHGAALYLSRAVWVIVKKVDCVFKTLLKPLQI